MGREPVAVHVRVADVSREHSPPRKLQLDLGAANLRFSKRDGKADSRIEKHIVVREVGHPSESNSVTSIRERGEQPLRDAGLEEVAERGWHRYAHDVVVDGIECRRTRQRQVFNRRRLNARSFNTGGQKSPAGHDHASAQRRGLMALYPRRRGDSDPTARRHSPSTRRTASGPGRRRLLPVRSSICEREREGSIGSNLRGIRRACS